MNKPTGASPCSKCNNTKLEWDGWEGSWNVYCPKCGNGGRAGKDKQEAIKMWNEQESKV